MATRIRPKPMVAPLMKRPREQSSAYLDWIRKRPCVVTGKIGVEAAHVRYGSIIHGKRETGAGEKPSDKWVLPLSPEEHRVQHSGSERRYWHAKGLDPLCLCALLWSAWNSGDDEAGDQICRGAREIALWIR